MPTPPGKYTVTIYVDLELREKINKLADFNDQPTSRYIVSLVKAAIKRAEAKGDI